MNSYYEKPLKQVDLSKYANIWYKPGNKLKRAIWYLANVIFFKTSVPFPNKLKILLLTFFGAKIGRELVIKPNVNIKYPWFLEVGDNVWIGENSWIDNLVYVRLGSSVCISQGAYIFTGNHNYKREAFDLIVEEVVIEDGVWVGAKAVICPGVRLKTHSVITVGSVVTKSTEPYAIYQGTPAEMVKARIME